jgi:hypothetical protein
MPQVEVSVVYMQSSTPQVSFTPVSIFASREYIAHFFRWQYESRMVHRHHRRNFTIELHLGSTRDLSWISFSLSVQERHAQQPQFRHTSFTASKCITTLQWSENTFEVKPVLCCVVRKQTT